MPREVGNIYFIRINWTHLRFFLRFERNKIILIRCEKTRFETLVERREEFIEIDFNAITNFILLEFIKFSELFRFCVPGWVSLLGLSESSARSFSLGPEHVTCAAKRHRQRAHHTERDRKRNRKGRVNTNRIIWTFSLSLSLFLDFLCFLCLKWQHLFAPNEKEGILSFRTLMKLMGTF